MKTALVTGGNIGLGYECALELARKYDYRVVLACRDAAKASVAAERIKRKVKNAQIECVPLDLSSFQSIRSCVDAIRERELGPIDLLFCNAGIQIVNGLNTSPSGVELTFATNHLGHFLLSNLCLTEMSKKGVIVFTASGTHDPAQKTGIPAPQFATAELVAFPDKDRRDHGDTKVQAGQRRYSTSKLCNVMCAYEMSRRLRAIDPQSGLRVLAFDPGMMPGTGLARTYPPIIRFLWSRVLPVMTLWGRNVNTPRTSGRRLARLGADPAFQHSDGGYYEGLAPIKSSKASYDQVAWADLWEVSERLVGLQPADSILHTKSLSTLQAAQ